jgi:hypothetical protein
LEMASFGKLLHQLAKTQHFGKWDIPNCWKCSRYLIFITTLIPVTWLVLTHTISINIHLHTIANMYGIYTSFVNGTLLL